VARGGHIEYHDPHVPVLQHLEHHAYLEGRASVSLSEATLKEYDAAVILTAHEGVYYTLVGNTVPLIIDTRNVYGKDKPKAVVAKA
jgi:UDP-N-acetyl-D-glucosamine dehydrogenase